MSTNINNMPNEVLVLIFQNLNSKSELTKCCAVSQLWNQLASSNEVWLDITQKEFGKIMIPKDEDTSIKGIFSQLQSKKLNSNDEIIDQLQQFLDRCSLNENCRFRCIIGSGNGYKHITAEIKSQNNPSNEIEIREDFCSSGIENQTLTRSISPRPKSFFIAFTHGTFTLIMREPDYSDPTKPHSSCYRRIAGASNHAIITVDLPNGPNISETQMAKQIRHMVLSKCIETVQSDIRRIIKNFILGGTIVYISYNLYKRIK